MKKRLIAKPRRKRKSVILTMKYVLDIYDDDNIQAQQIGQNFIAWMKDVYSEWNESVLQNFQYDCNIQENSDNDRLHLEILLDKIIKDDTKNEITMEKREVQELNLNNENKDTSSSETTTHKQYEE